MSNYIFDCKYKIAKGPNSPQRNKHKKKTYKKQAYIGRTEQCDSKIEDKKLKGYKSMTRSKKSNMSYYVFGENFPTNHSHACQMFNKHPQTTLNEDFFYDEYTAGFNQANKKLISCISYDKITKPLIEEIFHPSFGGETNYKDVKGSQHSSNKISIKLRKNEDFTGIVNNALADKVDVKLSCHPLNGTSVILIKEITGKLASELQPGTSMTLLKEITSKPAASELQPDNTKSVSTVKLETVDVKLSSQILPEDVIPYVCKMDWNNYHRLEVIHTFMDDLERDFPSLCTTDVIGQSIEGRDLKILKISNSEASNSAVWIDAGIHAREWIAPAVNTYVANYLARNFDSLPNSITSKDWYFLPVVNPDGYEYSHTKNRMWRKNRAWYSGECVGVDLNRNFSFNWGGRGSSSNPTHCFYRGPEPFSEPESIAIREFMINSGVNFKVYLTLHSFGEVIIFPFASSDHLCPDYIRLLQGATIMSKAIFETNGNTYKVGVSKDVMYTASGTSNDWCYGEVGIPFCYLIELRSKKHRFKLPKEEIDETGNEILNCIMALMEFVDHNVCDNDIKNQRKRK